MLAAVQAMHVAAFVSATMHIRKWWKRATVTIFVSDESRSRVESDAIFRGQNRFTRFSGAMPSFVVEASFVQSTLKLHLERDTS